MRTRLLVTALGLAGLALGATTGTAYAAVGTATDLHVTAMTGSTATLAWSRVVGATQYRVTDSARPQWSLTLDATARSVTVADLQPGVRGLSVQPLVKGVAGAATTVRVAPHALAVTFSDVSAVSAVNPLFTGAYVDPNAGPQCFMGLWVNPVCGATAVRADVAGWTPDETGTPVSWQVRAKTVRAFGCASGGHANWPAAVTLTRTVTFSLFGGSDSGIRPDGTERIGQSYAFHNSDMPALTCPAGTYPAAYGTKVSEVVLTAQTTDAAGPVTAAVVPLAGTWTSPAPVFPR